MARRQLQGERRGHTLQTTAIVHEAYIRIQREKPADWQNRAHFFAVAARAMRRILVDYARQKAARKRGGDGNPYLLEVPASEPKAVDLLAVDHALDRLARLDADQARLIELRFFAGLTEEEAAEVLEVSHSTVRRRWTGAKAWLLRELSRPTP
jgi:RNA polymerase sigma factor (TIGR02999 family)